MTSTIVQSCRLVNRIRLPKISASSRARARASVRQVSRRVAGVSPVNDTLMTRLSQRGARIRSISVWTAAIDLRVRLRARRAWSSDSCRRALARVWSKPRAWRWWKLAEWVMIARRVTPSASTTVSWADTPSNRSGSIWWNALWGIASSSGWSEGGSEVTYPSPRRSMWVWLSAELTVTYDSGQNSADNQTHIKRQGLGYVTALPPSDHPQLLAIGHDQFDVVDAERYEGVTAHDTLVEALGATRRAIITHSETFHQRQAAGFDQTLAKARRQLAELQARLARGRTRKTTAGIQTEIDKILAPRWLDRVITTTLTGDTPATRRLHWRTDTRARTRLADEIFGKRILFTNRHDWPVVDVVAAYRTQPDVEASFRQLKDPHVVSFSPMHHWTEQKIKVHAFYCVLALQIAHLMRRQTHKAGLEMSVRGLLTELAGIEETVLIYPSTGGRPKARRMLTDMAPTQQRLFDLFDLDRYTPTT